MQREVKPWASTHTSTPAYKQYQPSTDALMLDGVAGGPPQPTVGEKEGKLFSKPPQDLSSAPRWCRQLRLGPHDPAFEDTFYCKNAPVFADAKNTTLAQTLSTGAKGKVGEIFDTVFSTMSPAVLLKMTMRLDSNTTSRERSPYPKMAWHPNALLIASVAHDNDVGLFGLHEVGEEPAQSVVPSTFWGSELGVRVVDWMPFMPVVAVGTNSGFSLWQSETRPANNGRSPVTPGGIGMLQSSPASAHGTFTDMKEGGSKFDVNTGLERSYSTVFNFDAGMPCDVLAFAPNGELLATACGNNLIMWNAKMLVAGQDKDACCVRQYRRSGGPITCMTWSLCGRYLAVGHEERRFRLWDTRSWTAITYACDSSVVAMHWTDNGRFADVSRPRRGSDADEAYERLPMGSYSSARLFVCDGFSVFTVPTKMGVNGESNTDQKPTLLHIREADRPANASIVSMAIDPDTLRLVLAFEGCNEAYAYDLGHFNAGRQTTSGLVYKGRIVGPDAAQGGREEERMCPVALSFARKVVGVGAPTPTAVLAVCWQGRSQRMIRTYPFFFICARKIAANPTTLWSAENVKTVQGMRG